MNIDELSKLEPYSKEYIINNENNLRQSIVNTALKYKGAKYHINGMIPYTHCDCHTLLILTYTEAKLIKLIQPKYYSPQFFMHRNDTTYFEGIKEYGYEVKEAKLGDIILYQLGKAIAHSSIIINDTQIIHAVADMGKVVVDERDNPRFMKRERYIYSLWEN